jgi:hypothetical protein
LESAVPAKSEKVAVEEMAALIFTDVESALRSLPEAEQRYYEECQQSVVDARRAANRNEGRNVIC